MSVPLSGQVVVTGTAQPLSAAPVSCAAWTLKAPQSNGHPVFVGGPGVTVSTGHQLDAGDTLDYEVRSQNGQNVYPLRPSDIYVAGTSPDVVTWFASPA